MRLKWFKFHFFVRWFAKNDKNISKASLCLSWPWDCLQIRISWNFIFGKKSRRYHSLLVPLKMCARN